MLCLSPHNYTCQHLPLCCRGKHSEAARIKPRQETVASYQLVRSPLHRRFASKERGSWLHQLTGLTVFLNTACYKQRVNASPFYACLQSTSFCERFPSYLRQQPVVDCERILCIRLPFLAVRPLRFNFQLSLLSFTHRQESFIPLKTKQRQT